MGGPESYQPAGRVEGVATSYPHISIVGPRGIAAVLLPLLALESSTLMPRLDDQVVGRPADPCQHHLGDVDLEAMRRLILIRGSSDLDCAAGDLGIAQRSGRLLLRRCLA